nr:hypothetical protein [Barrientosiimonas endolithica]
MSGEERVAQVAGEERAAQVAAYCLGLGDDALVYAQRLGSGSRGRRRSRRTWPSATWGWTCSGRRGRC